jgi:hypothetical protein
VTAAAPELPLDLAWVNTTAPPRLAAVRGRVVLLWFWTFDSIACWNTAPELRRLEDKYHDGLCVIGVHCPRFPHQCAPEAVLHAVNRLQVRHAVASDPAARVWRAYGIEAWPSMALVDAEGRLASIHAGEGRAAEVEARIEALLEEAVLHDVRVFEPSAPALRPEPRTALLFPSGLATSERLLYVADRGQHRVLECQPDGRVLRTFGSGNAGFADGSASQACFDDPRGLARAGQALYVAVRANHALRRIDLASGAVATVLGTGRRGRSRPQHAPARQTVLDTPVGVAVAGDHVVVAVAGQNQVWRLDPASGTVSVLAGRGEAGLEDGPGPEARLAQPSALAVLGRHLAVADAAASAVRWIDLDSGRVTTAVGSGLFDWGDANGGRDVARLQHPLGLAADMHGTLYVADSYNGMIRLLSRRSGELRRLRLDYRLDEPHALALSGGLLWIANTNLHEIACVDLGAGSVRRVPVAEG